MNFLDKLPKAQRDNLIRKVVALGSGQKPKPATQADIARDLLRRTLGNRQIVPGGRRKN